MIIVLIVTAFLVILVLLKFAKQEKITKNTVLCFTGGLGSGKTYMAVKMALKFYRKQKFKYKLTKMLKGKKCKADKPCLVSNIPIRINKKEYSIVLTKEHLLLKKDLPEKCIIVIDELGQVASQYDYDNPYVMCQLQELIRFYRHYTDGKFIVTDQSSSNIVIPIRRRINIIYNLNNFSRYFKILPFFKCDVAVLEVTEESISNNNQMQSTESHLLTNVKLQKPYFFGFLPYKWQKNAKHYDSRCYSIRYNHDLKDKEIEKFEQMKTAYLIDIAVTQEQRKQFSKDRKPLE